jgi:hypothetical protein
MAFEKFEGPFADAETLGCRDVFCGQRLMLDLFEYQRGAPLEDSALGTEAAGEAYPIGLTESSRIWRITFERPFAVRIRDQTLGSKNKAKINLPARCSFSEHSEWINEFVFDQSLGVFTPTHYIFDLVDNFIEIMGDDSPTVEEIQNETMGEGTEN